MRPVFGNRSSSTTPRTASLVGFGKRGKAWPLLLIPGTHLVLGGGKEGKFYLLDRDDLGGYHAGDDTQIVQSFHATAGHIHGSPVFWDSDVIGPTAYVWSEYDHLKAFSFNGSRFSTVPRTSSMRVPPGMPGGMLSISANGRSAGSGIVWASHPTRHDANHSTTSGTLRAFDAEDIGRELWNSDMNYWRDHVGNFAKFVTPVVQNGKVYLATFSDELAVYGLLDGVGSGLLAEYFDDVALSHSSMVRVDSTVNFDWRDAAPASSLSADGFSVRWLGSVQPRYGETYTFATTSDDGVRLWVDGMLLIDDWTDHPRRVDTASIALERDVKYAIRMEFYERGGDAVAQLAWSSPTQALEVVPRSRLFPSDGTGIGLNAEYFDGSDFAERKLSRLDPGIDFDWSTDAPDPKLGRDNFSVRWTGELEAATTEDYYFRTVTDDGVRLWIDDLLLVDNWTDHPRTQDVAELSLVAGMRYAVRMEYYERGGEALARLEWATASQPWQAVPPPRLHPTASIGSGLRAEYFSRSDPNQPVLVRVDPSVDFEWGTSSPDPRVPRDNFLVRWTGQIMPRFTETYAFVAESDDGVRLWVNGTLLVDHAMDHPRTFDTGLIALRAGQRYDIVMEFHESSGEAIARLWWSSASQAEQIVPARQLYPGPVAGRADSGASAW
jgi:hypothetical protein